MYKLGTKVWVCWDGKLGRRCEGVVVATHRGKAVSIRFTLWMSDVTVTHKFRVGKRERKWGGPGKQVRGYVPYPGLENCASWYRVYRA